MGRVKTFNRDEAVIKVMYEIWEKGYEACSVKSLSESLGLTRSSFYNAFGSREELFLEVLEVYFAQSIDANLQYINANDDILLSICKVFKSVCDIRAEDSEHKGCLAVNSIIELVGTDEKVGPILADTVQKSVTRFEHLLELAASKGELEANNLRNKALALQNLLIGINVLCKVIHDNKTLWQSTKSTLLGLGVYKASFSL